MKVEFGERLRELREDKGLRQEDVGALFGFGKSTVSQWESGKSQPEFKIVVKLADYFNVSVDYLLGRKTLAVTVEGLLRDLDEKEIMMLHEQADFYRYRKGLPEDAQGGSTGLTITGKEDKKIRYKRAK